MLRLRRAKKATEAVAETLSEYIPVGPLKKQTPQRHAAQDALAFSTGLLFGGLAAGAAAIALAPTDGATLRQRLKEKVDGLLGRVPSAPAASGAAGPSPAPAAGLSPAPARAETAPAPEAVVVVTEPAEPAGSAPAVPAHPSG